MSDLMLDVDQAGELKAAFRRGNWTNQEIKRLCEGTVLANVRRVVLGYASITVIEHLIDCDVAPSVPKKGWKIEEHQKGGLFKWNDKGVELYLSATQRGKGSIEYSKLRKELASKAVLNANVLDYLLKNPHLIPEEWKSKVALFLGTIYRDSGGVLCARCLCWDGSWSWQIEWLDSKWDDDYSVAVIRTS